MFIRESLGLIQNIIAIVERYEASYKYNNLLTSSQTHALKIPTSAFKIVEYLYNIKYLKFYAHFVTIEILYV